MSSRLLKKLVAIGAFAVAVPLAVGAPVFAATNAPQNTASQSTALAANSPKGNSIFLGSGDGPTSQKAADAAVASVKNAIQRYESETGQKCKPPLSMAIAATQTGPESWHATGQASTTCE